VVGDSGGRLVLVDSRLAARGLGIATFADRLVDALATDPTIRVSRWQAPGEWGRRAQLATLGRCGLFDLSPRLDPRTARFDVVHYLSNIGSVVPGRASVMTVHDLLYRRSRRARDRWGGFLLERSVRRVGKVVAVSGRTAAEIEASWPDLRGRVEVIPHGMRTLEPPAAPRAHVLAFGGGGDPRKRVELMVAAYGRYRVLARDPRPLVVLARAGLTGGQRQALATLGAQVLDRASSGQVDRLVAGAAAVLYPTTTEGFGLPILEAAEVGTPVVMDRGADVAREVVGRHCVLVDGSDPTDWAAAIVRAIEGGPVVDALDLPDWGEVARRYAELYRQVAG
jgi:glycosyltransferase involved in cell wall biosynthesis